MSKQWLIKWHVYMISAVKEVKWSMKMSFEDYLSVQVLSIEEQLKSTISPSEC